MARLPQWEVDGQNRWAGQSGKIEKESAVEGFGFEDGAKAMAEYSRDFFAVQDPH